MDITYFRREKDMNFKATVLACMTFLAGIAFVIMYASQQDRYAIFAQDKAIFVFDRKNATLNYCNDHACQLITPYVGENGVMPAQMAVLNGQQAGMMQMAQFAQPFMPQMAPQSSLQSPSMPMQQPQQVVLVTNPQMLKASAPAAPAAPAPASAAPAPAADAAATPAAEAPAE